MAAVRMHGGPYDGAEFDADALFGGPPPGRLSVGGDPRDGRSAYYDLSRHGDAAGVCYLFAGWSEAPPRPASPPGAERPGPDGTPV